MSEPTAIFANIKMTKAAAHLLYKKKGKALASDYYGSINATQLEKEVDQLMKKMRGTGTQKEFYAFQEAEAKLRAEYRKTWDSTANPNDILIIRYDDASQSLFYFHLFNYDGLEVAKMSISLNCFLENIAAFKDVDTTDHIFFSNWATNILEGGFYKVWQVLPDEIQEMNLYSLSIQDKAKLLASFSHQLSEVDALSKKYYFDVVDKFITSENCVSYLDEEGLDACIKDEMLDKELYELSS